MTPSDVERKEAPLTPAQRKDRMPHGGRRRVAKRQRPRVAESYVSAVMAGEVRPKTKRTKLKLRRTQVECAREMGLTLELAFSEDELALSAIEQLPLARAG